MNTDKIYAEKIASEYAHRKNRKAIALKKLDRYIKKSPTINAYVFGAFSSILVWLGNNIVLRVIQIDFRIGVFITLIGIIGIYTNYFIYKFWVNKNKSKYANDVLQLAEEIIKESK